MMRAFVLAIVALIFWTVSAVSVSADPVRVRASVQADAARIVFGWAEPVYYEANRTSDVLRLRFGRSIQADMPAITAALGRFVRSAQIVDDMTVEIRLTDDVADVAHYPTGAAIVVELIPANTDTPTTEAQAIVPAPELPTPEQVGLEPGPSSSDGSAVERVATRTGLHADKLRLVFDWARDADYRLDRDGEITRLTFDRPADIEVDGLARRLPDVVGDARARVVGDETVVELAIPENARIEHFKVGSKVVADVFPAATGDVAGRLPPIETVDVPDPEPVLAEPEIGSETDTTGSDVAAPINPTSDDAPEIAVVDGDEQPTVQDTTTAAATDIAAEADAESVDVSVADGSVGEPQSLDAEPQQAAIDAPTEPVSDVGADVPAADAADVSKVAPRSATILTEEGATPVRVDPLPDDELGFSLTFEWDNPVGAAVFRRGGALWLVFDQFTPVDTDGVRGAAGINLVDVAQLPHDDATVLRMSTERGFNPVARRDGLNWIVDFKQQDLTTLAPIRVTPQPDSPVGSRVFLPVPEPGRAVALTDPEIGDNFVVVPVIPLGYGVTRLYEYPQFRVRPSSQGAVVEPRIDTLRVRPLREGIEITSTRKLYVSPVSVAELAKTGIDGDRPLSRIADFEPLAGANVATMMEKRRRLEDDIASADGLAGRQAARLDLAKFYVAHGFGAEALGVLREREREEASAAGEAEHRLYNAIGNFTMARYEPAQDAIDSVALGDNDEATFWRSAAALAAQDRSSEVVLGLRSTLRIPETYPDALRVPMQMWALEAIMQTGDTPMAEKLIEVIRADTLSPKQENQLTYYEGRLARLIGDTEIAIGLFEQAAEGPDRPTAAEAAMSRTEMLVELDRIDSATAAEDLEDLRFAWRGGDFEFELLRRIGNLQLLSGRFRDGLSTLRQAATYFREHPEAPRVTATMVEVFNTLFLEGLADRMPPVSAIAIYQEFKELTPPGKLGDRMIEELADRLANVELFDLAADLLDAQVKFRLTGVERARVGAQLTLVHLLNRDYEMALAALDESDAEGLPSELEMQRLYLRSRGLIGSGQSGDALALIEDDDSLSAEQLRAQVYWARRDWRNASRAFNRILASENVRPGSDLSDRDALNVLNYAISLTLAGNERAVAGVNRDFGSGMAQTEFADAFKLIATPETFGPLDVAEVADKVQDAEDFGTFLASYRDQVRDEGLSAIN